MNCLAVREELALHALSVLDGRHATALDRHLEWCAGCRKEANELQEAAASLTFALSPAEPPKDLEERIVRSVTGLVGGIRPGGRRARSALASVVAAMVTVAALGWGAVMAGRADRYRVRSVQAETQRSVALQQFQKVLQGLQLQVPRDSTRLGRLSPTSGQQGGGAVLVLASPTVMDFSIVIVNGLPLKDPAALPYRVTLSNAGGVTIGAGRIKRLSDGGGQVFHQFSRSISSFTKVAVRDASGTVVLEGIVGPGSDLGSP